MVGLIKVLNHVTHVWACVKWCEVAAAVKVKLKLNHSGFDQMCCDLPHGPSLQSDLARVQSAFVRMEQRAVITLRSL